MSFNRHWRPIHLALLVTTWAGAGCVEAGSLKNKEEFRSLLSLDGGASLDGAAPGEDASFPGSMPGPSTGTGGRPATGTGGAPTTGTGGSPAGAPDAGGTDMPGCPEACDLFKMRCATAGCHAASSPASGLDLISRNIATRLADKAATSTACSSETLIDTAMPGNSLLYSKLVNPPACGARMPLGAPLSDTQIDCVRRWLLDPVCPGDTQ